MVIAVRIGAYVCYELFTANVIGTGGSFRDVSANQVRIVALVAKPSASFVGIGRAFADPRLSRHHLSQIIALVKHRATDTEF